VSDDGVYILENGLYMFFYIGLAANPAWISDVFGVQTAAQVNTDKPKLEERDNDTSQQVNTAAIVDQSDTKMSVRIDAARVRQMLPRQNDKFCEFYEFLILCRNAIPKKCKRDYRSRLFADYFLS
jgi:hypothetical protein